MHCVGAWVHKRSKIHVAVSLFLWYTDILQKKSNYASIEQSRGEMKLYHIFEKSLSVIPQTAMPKTPIHEMIKKKPITKQNKNKQKYKSKKRSSILCEQLC